MSKNRCKLLFSIEKSGAGAYRYGFNGKENDNEVKGEGNQQDYGMRIYDPRVGRFLSVDPLSHYYPELTPYQFSSNSPIKNIDLDGAEAMPDDLLRRAINSGVSALKSYTTTKVEQLTKEVANAGMQYGVNKVDKAAANKLVNYAKDIDARVGSYSEDQKQKIFKTNAEQTKAVLLYEFAKGEGQTNREFDYNSPITKEIASGYVLKDIKSGINDFAKNSSYEDFKGSDGISVPISFSPSSSPGSWGPSLYRHIASNKSQFFMGGAIAKITPAAKDGFANVTITNKTSRSSLMLHSAQDYDDPDKPLSTRTQTFTFSIKIDKNSFKSEPTKTK